MSESAQSIKQARAARARQIRRRVATGAVTLFVGVWALIAIELVTGHDPALAAHKSTTASSGTSATTTTSSTGSSDSSGSSSTDGSGSSDGSTGFISPGGSIDGATGSSGSDSSAGSTGSTGSNGSSSQSSSPSSVTTQQS